MQSSSLYPFPYFHFSTKLGRHTGLSEGWASPEIVLPCCGKETYFTQSFLPSCYCLPTVNANSFQLPARQNFNYRFGA